MGFLVAFVCLFKHGQGKVSYLNKLLQVLYYLTVACYVFDDYYPIWPGPENCLMSELRLV